MKLKNARIVLLLGIIGHKVFALAAELFGAETITKDLILNEVAAPAAH